ncbi:hypothetical protein FB451DRAFT_1379355 [Mycena latifolia]|nr:hypothetical protein FB451DRAFT_1379355 [Mycena latifolia]
MYTLLLQTENAHASRPNILVPSIPVPASPHPLERHFLYPLRIIEWSRSGVCICYIRGGGTGSFRVMDLLSRRIGPTLSPALSKALSSDDLSMGAFLPTFGVHQLTAVAVLHDELKYPHLEDSDQRLSMLPATATTKYASKIAKKLGTVWPMRRGLASSGTRTGAARDDARSGSVARGPCGQGGRPAVDDSPGRGTRYALDLVSMNTAGARCCGLRGGCLLRLRVPRGVVGISPASAVQSGVHCAAEHTPNPADTRARAALLPGLACTVATAQRHRRSREALLVDVDAPAKDGRTAIDEIGAWYTVHDRDVASRSRELGREADSSGGRRGVFRMMSESWKRGTMGLAEGQR